MPEPESVLEKMRPASATCSGSQRDQSPVMTARSRDVSTSLHFDAHTVRFHISMLYDQEIIENTNSPTSSSPDALRALEIELEDLLECSTFCSLQIKCFHHCS